MTPDDEVTCGHVTPDDRVSVFPPLQGVRAGQGRAGVTEVTEVTDPAGFSPPNSTSLNSYHLKFRCSLDLEFIMTSIRC